MRQLTSLVSDKRVEIMIRAALAIYRLAVYRTAPVGGPETLKWLKRLRIL